MCANNTPTHPKRYAKPLSILRYNFLDRIFALLLPQFVAGGQFHNSGKPAVILPPELQLANQAEFQLTPHQMQRYFGRTMERRVREQITPVEFNFVRDGKQTRIYYILGWRSDDTFWLMPAQCEKGMTGKRFAPGSNRATITKSVDVLNPSINLWDGFKWSVNYVEGAGQAAPNNPHVAGKIG